MIGVCLIVHNDGLLLLLLLLLLFVAFIDCNYMGKLGGMTFCRNLYFVLAKFEIKYERKKIERKDRKKKVK